MFGRKHFAPEGEGAGGGAPPAVVIPVAAPAPVAAPPPAPAAAPPVAAAPPPATDPTTDPAWFKSRLEREAASGRKAALAELGITDVAAAKTALAAANAAAEATKSAETRATEASLKLTAQQAELERYASTTREHAARMIAVLTPEQQAAVRSLSPDTDPAGQLHAIGVLGPTWAAAANAAAALAVANAPPPAPAPPPAAAPPASTAPGATAPTGGPTTSPPDHKAVYQASRAKNPFAAAAYGLEHASEVYRPKA